MTHKTRIVVAGVMLAALTLHWWQYEKYNREFHDGLWTADLIPAGKVERINFHGESVRVIKFKGGIFIVDYPPRRVLKTSPTYEFHGTPAPE